MGIMKLNIATICLLLLLASTANASVFNLRSYGAKANSDITQPLLKAWKEACASAGPSKVVVPKKTYRLGTVNLQGPCKGRIEVQVLGILQAPGPDYFKGGHAWVTIQSVDHFTLSGGGTFDGKGKSAWGNCGRQGQFCGTLPVNIRFDFVTNSIVRDITSLNSKQFHMNVLGCKNLTFQHVNITAPENSPNTDGIHIGRSTGINIIDSKIGTGDDCISIGDGSRSISIMRVSCGPGHGFAIGSLGRYQGEEPVVGVTIRNCTLTKTSNGVRIKTWPSSPIGYASNMHFSNIIMNNVGFPILIDQQYCPWNQCKLQNPSKIKLSDVSFKNIRGTSTTNEVVKLLCSNGVPCEKVELHDIDVRYNGPLGPATSKCVNVKPLISGTMNPVACTDNV